MTLAANLTKKNKTVYQQVAEQYGVTARYVGKIARSERTPTKKIGLEVKKALEQLASTN
jgi:transcriptional regulator with XRE-family HTH domain